MCCGVSVSSRRLCSSAQHPRALLPVNPQLDVAATWISVAPTDDARFIKRVGQRAAEFTFAPLQWHPSLKFTDPVFGSSAEYVAAFRSMYGYTPSYSTASGTASGLSLQLAIESAASPDIEDVVQVWRTLWRKGQG